MNIPKIVELNPAIMRPSGGKIIFANQLRGIAALFVATSHLCGVFWVYRDTVAYYIGAPPYLGQNPVNLLESLSIPYFNYGPFGVALFFLISGFVIPFSLEKLSSCQFIAARFFRIYPLYVVAVSLSLMIVWYISHHYESHLPWDLSTLFINLTLINSNFSYPSVDLVNWTLTIELKFYIVAACLASFIRKAKIYPLLILGLVAIFLNIATVSYPTPPLGHFNPRAITDELMFICFMQIGVLFNYHINKRISFIYLAISSAMLFSMFLFAWINSIRADQFYEVTPSYAAGFVVFVFFYFFRGFFRPNKFLDFFADISYPFYVIHSLIGYALIRLLIDQGVNLYICIISALIVTAFIAYVLHILIEIPSSKLGKNYIANTLI
jgi:peptidoglycan/LPS O-acetylase OafA/YrhL